MAASPNNLEAVTREIEEQRVTRLARTGGGSGATKQWRRALGAWQALLDILPNDIDAQTGAHEARVERAEKRCTMASSMKRSGRGRRC